MRIKLIALASVAALALAACGGNSTPSNTSTDTDWQAALTKGGDLTVWSWEPTLTDVVKNFQAKYPQVHVNLVNAGTGDKEYTALQQAVAAGSGVPDVAHIEYQVIPQFAQSGALADLTGFIGSDDPSKTYTPGPWNGVHFNNLPYGLPMDSGPEALFYNKAVFDQYNIKVPTTWDEYLTAAQQLHAANPNAYITNDTGDAGFITSMIWQAGGRPFKVDGTTVKIDFSDANTQKFVALWQKLIDQKLLAPISSWSDDWNKGLGDGTIASLTIGAWMPANLESGAAAASGNWRVTGIPQWTAGDKVNSENGGSSLAVTQASTNKALAYAFIHYATTGEGATTRASEGAFPATQADLASSDFLNKTDAYFGGQQYNQVLAQAASDVATGWQYLPYQGYANSIFNDNVGKAYTGESTLADGLKAWQDALIAYGTEQGFTAS